MWSMFVDGLSGLIAQLAHLLNGSYGAAVLAMAVIIRLLLLPMTLRVAEYAWHRQATLLKLKPDLERLRERYANDSAAYAAAMQSLYRKHGVHNGIGSGALTALVQAPLGAGVYQAIRQSVAGAGSFLWVKRLARPDAWLAIVVALLSCAVIALNPALSDQARTLLHWLPVIITLLVTWHLSAGLCLYWSGGASVSVLQSALLRRRIHRSQRAPTPRHRS